jgi:hypothetical protein
MSFYARLKKEVNGKKVNTAVLLGKRILYPDDPRWMKREDMFLAQAKNDERIEILETQKEFVDYSAKEDEEIENLIRGHHRTAQVKIEKMEDQFYLKKLLAKAQQLNKETVAETIEKRLEFLNTPQYGKA